MLTFLTAESMQSKLTKQAERGSFLLSQYFIWIGIQKRSIQSPDIPPYKWEVPVPINQEDTKAQRRLKTHILLQEYLEFLK